MNSDEIREAYLQFFEEKEHRRIASSSLVPKSDTTLLLTSAGMVQMKPYFTGEAAPPGQRMTSCQKCFRVTDIDDVGDTTHLTFFEMLGNFSVGDYFKKDAVAWAWEFVIDRLKMAPERLWVTIYLDDDEAFQCWRDIGFPEERIKRFEEKDNFWGPAGNTGPCGPCSELHYDFGEHIGCGLPACGPNCECGRFVEIWNLVFMQYDQRSDGSRVPLPKPNIDTGMGLERTAAVMQGVITVYETDAFKPLIEHICKLANKQYGQHDNDDRAIRILADHSRAITFLIADGVLPSNEGRGYVLRRVLRRAALFGRKLGVAEGLIGELAKDVISRMSPTYPELKREKKHILATIEAEESRFRETLNVGINLLDDIISNIKGANGNSVCGEDVFRLYDTYGFPLDVTKEIAAENDMEVDMEGFEQEMEKQREKARSAHKFKLDDKAAAKLYAGENLPEVGFVGDDCSKLKHRSDILMMTANGAKQSILSEGDEGEIVLRETPFYGEMGGQVSDSGEILGPHGRFVVESAYHIGPDLTVHRGRVAKGRISAEDIVAAKVDEERRRDIARNHTATHLLQAALRQVLGDHVRQSGSLVAPDYFRFDFTHQRAMTNDESLQIQRIVNENIRRNFKVTARVMPYKEAMDAGALAFFDEKYADEVRVMEVGRPSISTELCGGSHVNATGEIGLLLISSEGGIGAGIRRIEAVTGRGAERFIEERQALIDTVAGELKAAPSEIAGRISVLRKEVDTARKKAIAAERESIKGDVDSLLDGVVDVDGVKVLAAQVSASNADALRGMGDLIKERVGSVLVVLAAEYNGQANFLAMLTPDLIDKGLHAGNIIKQITKVVDGRGGGRTETGQGGGKDIARIEDALKMVRELVAHGDPGA
ncbi:MAG: alanine--tRNA ligase [Chloroflexota bacterium]|nr:alanine--tRNA ligase [Chloroflexota bacterium]